MKTKELIQQKDRLDALFLSAKKLTHDPYLTAHWARYLCVLVSGFVENSLRELLRKYATAKSHKDVACFVGKRLNRFSNAKMGAILSLMDEFGSDHKKHIESIALDVEKDAINSVVANRHQIAHGRDVQIGMATLQNYYKEILKVIEKIEERFEP